MARIKEAAARYIAGPKDGAVVAKESYPRRVMDPEMGRRIGEVCRLYSSRKDAAAAARKSTDMLVAYENAKAEPSPSALVALARGAGVSIEWLLTGHGPMKESQRALASPDELRRDGFVMIPRYAVEAAAGAGAVVEQEQIVDFLAFKADWLRGMGRNPSTLLVIQAMGDSMETTIEHGDVLLVDRTETRIRDNAIYVLVFGDALVVKRLHRRRDGSVVIRSDNPRYPEEVVPKEEVDSLRVIGDVFWTGGRV